MAFEAQSPRRDLETTSVPASDTASSRRLQVWLRVAPWLVGIYFAGVALMLFRLAGSIIRTERLRALAKPIAEGALVHSLRVLSRKWSMGVVPVLAQADGILVPTVFGLFKPTILLPASAITGLSTSELEMIVAHELAHVRRYDTWVNLLQRLAEALLFFNPALWLLSWRIGSLREYCCDELTCREMSASHREPRLRYATALLKIVELARPETARQSQSAALAATGRSPSELRRRVARLFGEPLREPVRLSRGGVLLLAIVALVVACGPAIWPTQAETTGVPNRTEQTSDAAGDPVTEQFSFGSEVEVLAIGTHDETPQRWWDAHGKRIESVPFTWQKDSVVSSGDKVWRRIVFCVDSLPEDADLTWKIMGARASAGGKVQFKNEASQRKCFTRYFGVAEDQKAVDLRVGVATGAWRTAVEMGTSGAQAIGGPANRSLVYSGAFATQRGTEMVVSHNYFDLNFRVVAIDKRGRTHDTAGRGGVSAGGIYQTRAAFANLEIEDIDHFEFQVRDYEWIGFENLPLNPSGGRPEQNNPSGDALSLDDSPEGVRKRAEWLEKLPRLSSHNQTAFAVGPLLIFELPANDAFEVVRRAWPKLESNDVKTGLLKTFQFDRHPRVLDVLDLGAHDSSEMVRDYAYSYLENYAMRDFKAAEHDYAAWRREQAGQPVERVLEANAGWLVKELRTSKPPDDAAWWMRLDMMLNLNGNKTSYPSKARYLRDAGILDVLQAWIDDPAVGDVVKRHAAEIRKKIRKASLAEDKQTTHE